MTSVNSSLNPFPTYHNLVLLNIYIVFVIKCYCVGVGVVPGASIDKYETSNTLVYPNPTSAFANIANQSSRSIKFDLIDVQEITNNIHVMRYE